MTDSPLPTPSLAVVICVHNAPEYTGICIDAVLEHTPAPYALILVNDGSDMPTTQLLREYAKAHEHIHLIHHHSARGYTVAANAGLKHSRADYTVLLNSDTIVSPQWAERLIACGESDPAIGIIGPLSNAATYQSVPYVFDTNGRWMQNELRTDETVAQFARIVQRASVQAYPKTPVANGFCFVVKRDLIDRIGYLDEETFPRGYGEENDYCLRAADAGFDIAIADDVYVYHATSKSFGVSQRESLTRHAHQAIRSKHSQERLDKLDQTLRNAPLMDAVRARILEAMSETRSHHDDLPPLQYQASDRAVLFLLPDCSAAAGGTQVVVEYARGLRQLGVQVRIAIKPSAQSSFHDFYPTQADLFWCYRSDSELVKAAAQYDIVIATIFHSTRQLAKIAAAHLQVIPAYFVQDYEPYFLEDRPDLKSLAAASYTSVPGCQLFAISPWVVETVQANHPVRVKKVRACLDPALYFPAVSRSQPAAPTVISCMIRPTTAWRGPKRSMRVLKALKEQHAGAIEIRTFGCPLDELFAYGLESRFDFSHYGLLGKRDVAALLRSSHIFLDLSDFQAFGRTALEAMACGCAVIAPTEGGIHDFASDGENALLVDTASDEDCITACNDLLSDPTKRQRLKQAGIETGLSFDIQRSSFALLEWLDSLCLAERNNKRSAA